MIQQRLENALATKILHGDYAEGDTIHVGIDKAKHDFTFQKGPAMAEPEMAQA